MSERTKTDQTPRLREMGPAPRLLDGLDNVNLPSLQVDPLLILDMDETLVYATTREIPHLNVLTRFEEYTVYERPHLSEFIASVREQYRVAIWTAAGRDYAQAVIESVFQNPSQDLDFFWTSERCTTKWDYDSGEFYNRKNLGKVRRSGEDLRQVLIVEDTPKNVADHYGNAIYISPFEGQENDRELLKLAAFLGQFRQEGHEDFRRIEKRWWSE
ncbi:MAG: HAD family hydrolase [Bdellovibrionales bacterium]|nr:HAD family hydrolase [Bdellovibrionales bacterium]